MRLLPERMRWVFRRERKDAPADSASLLDVVRAAVVGDEQGLERLAAVRSRERERRERERVEREQLDEARRQHEENARALRRHVERYGSWFPSDWR